MKPKPILVTRAALRSLGAAVIANETCIAINPFDLPNDELFADDEQTIDVNDSPLKRGA